MATGDVKHVVLTEQQIDWLVDNLLVLLDNEYYSETSKAIMSQILSRLTS